MLNLLDHYHKFTFKEVIDQYELRCKEPIYELDPDTLQEAENSLLLRFEAYNNYEFDDFGLPWLVVNLLISPSLME